MAVERIIIGREPEDLKAYGDKGCIFLGKHVVGKGFDFHLTNPILMDVLRPHVILITGKRGSGKCLEGNTLIPLNDGSLVPIKDFENNNNNIFALNDKFKISSAEKEGFFKRKVDKLLRIKLRSGKEIKLTPEHPLLTIRGWKDAKELTIGSRIATPRKIENFGNKTMEKYKIKLLSYLLAEGHLGNNFVLFSNSNKEINEDFSNAVKDFDANLKIGYHGPGSYRVVKEKRKIDTSKMKLVFKNNGCFGKGNYAPAEKSSIRKWLESIKIYGKLSKEKFIPSEIFNLKKEDLSLFLNRLFSCDGSIYKHKTSHGFVWEISYSSSSEKMIHQIQHLLLRFGILSRIRKKYTKINCKIFDSFEITIGTDNITRFIQEIGFFGEKSRKQNICLEEIADINRNPNVDTVPQEIWDMYRPKNWAECGRYFGYTTPKALRSSIDYSPSRQKLMQIARVDNNELIYLLATSDIFWDEIVLIEQLEGEFDVYDISVPELHNFVANDIIVHNSYTSAVIAEEVTKLPDEVRQNLSCLMIDTMGIFWSMKNPNDRQLMELTEWNLKPRGFDVKIIIPMGMKPYYDKYGISYDGIFSIKPSELSAADWALTFNISLFDPIGILLERIIKKLQGRDYSIEDIISEIGSDKRSDEKEKMILENRFLSSKGWGVFSQESASIENFLNPGVVTVLDVSLQETNVRSLMIGILCREIYQARMAARRIEEMELTGGEATKRVPMTWITIDECLPYESVVITEKAHTPIGNIVERFKNGEKFKVLGFDADKKEYGYFDVDNVYEKGERNIIKLITESGRELKCTPEHKILTSNGFTPAQSAEEVSLPVIQHYSSNEKLITARLVGHLFGDGWLCSKETGFSGKSKDLEKIKNNLKALGFSSGSIYSRETHSKIKTHDGKILEVSGKTQEVHSSAKACNFFFDLKVPRGKKVLNQFLLPEWLLNATKEEKAEFLASLMGSEGSMPNVSKKSPIGFDVVRFSFNKSIELEKNGFEYANQLKQLFETFDVKVGISKRKGNIRKDGIKTMKFVLTISNSTNNMINFLEKIGYRYCEEKEIKGNLVLSYLKAKQKLIKERDDLRLKCIELHKTGLGKIRISKILKILDYMVREWIYFGRKASVPQLEFPRFEEWLKSSYKNNLILEKIVKKEDAGLEKVYDISVSNVHNFVANGCIVHNCHEYLPDEGETPATRDLLTLLRQGRQPGVSLVLITQRPDKIHGDAISQADLVIAHRLTAKPDVEALSAIMQTYLLFDIRKLLGELPKNKGAALILDDNSERIFNIQVRPRQSWHAGESPVAIKEKGS